MATASNTTTQTDQPRRGWFGRNWKWFIPLSVILALVLGGGTKAAIDLWPNWKLKNSQAFADTLKELTTNAKVRAALGEPIVMDQWLPSGTQEERMIKLDFKVRGPKATGAVHSLSQLISDKWGLSSMEVVVDGGSVIKLTEEINVRDNGTPKFDPNQQPKPKPADEKPPENLNIEVK